MDFWLEKKTVLANEKYHNHAIEMFDWLQISHKK